MRAGKGQGRSFSLLMVIAPWRTVPSPNAVGTHVLRAGRAMEHNLPALRVSCCHKRPPHIQAHAMRAAPFAILRFWFVLGAALLMTRKRTVPCARLAARAFQLGARPPARVWCGAGAERSARAHAGKAGDGAAAPPHPTPRSTGLWGAGYARDSLLTNWPVRMCLCLPDRQALLRGLPHARQLPLSPLVCCTAGW